MVRVSGYRPDIDGLRAIAILLVVFYHAGFEVMSGGFVGVDVFFVISGYLITGILARRLSSGSFRFAHFYSRRIQRLLPAFYAVAFATSGIACLVLLPFELENFAASLLSALFFVSNFYFADVTNGYFTSDVDLLPLLHTWSLAVEEQFYLVWPPVLVGLRRRLSPASMRAVLAGSMVASFVAAEIAVRGQSDAAYYAPWSRAGELLMGALLALHHQQLPESGSADTTPAVSRRFADAGPALASLIGCAMIVGSATLLDDASLFPGVNALWPCLGTALLIHVGRDVDASSRRLLGAPPLVFVGLVSYALYLWHWPVFVFARTLRLDDGLATTWTLIGVSFVLATLSWRFVERPIRKRPAIALPRAVLRIFVVPMLGLTLFALFLLASHGLEARFSDEIREALRTVRNGPENARGICIKLDAVELPPESECLLGAHRDSGPGDVGGPDALLWGDSVANHYAGFLDEVGHARGIQLRDVTMAGCPPLLGSVRLERRKGALCRQRNEAVIDLVRSRNFDRVFLGANWSYYLERDGFLGDDVDMGRRRENSARVLRSSLQRTVSAIVATGAVPVVLRNVPRLDFDPSLCAIKNSVHPAPLGRDCKMEVARHRRQTREFDALLAELQDEHPTLRVVSVDGLLCRGEFCYADLDGLPVYRAGHADHLNMIGSRALGRAYRDRHGRL